MIESLSLIWRRADLSSTQFESHYETSHAPLARSMLPMLGYVRAYPAHEANQQHDVQGWHFDALSEFWYENDQVLAGIVDSLSSEAGAPLIEDEQRFMNKARNASFTAETRCSGARPAPGVARRFVVLVANSDAGSASFIDNYEARTRGFAMPGLICHERRHVVQPIKAPEPLPPAPLACVHSFWLDAGSGFAPLAKLCEQHGLAEPIPTNEFGSLPNS